MTILDDMARLARRVTGDFRFERLYPATVERVTGDLVDVLPDDPVMRGTGLQGVPMPTIDPTTDLLPEPGCRCLLGFQEGDPRRPAIMAWEYAPNTATVRLDGGVAGVARKGDLVDVLLAVGAVPITGTAYIPAPTPFVGTATITETVRGTIIYGTQKVKA